jgi:hypothetical protein
MTVTVRPMTVEDLPAVMQLEEELFAPDTWTEAMYRDELSRRDTRYYVVAEFDVSGDEDAPDGPPVTVGYGGLIAYDDETHVATLGVTGAVPWCCSRCAPTTKRPSASTVGGGSSRSAAAAATTSPAGPTQ